MAHDRFLDANQWQRIKPIVTEALDLPKRERAAYLDRACSSDAQLRQEVERYIVAYDNSPKDFLKTFHDDFSENELN